MKGVDLNIVQIIIIKCLCLITVLAKSQPSLIWSQSIDSVVVYSSPKVTDLNQDGVKDIVVGAGIENESTDHGILAFNGINGEVLWRLPARDQIYGTPIFQDINQDGVEDIFISGRDAQLYAIDGLEGTVIWEFWKTSEGNASTNGWYNFYNPQWIPDQNNDGIKDLLISNGGDATALPTNKNRPSGQLVIISGVTGELLAMDKMPDGKETYFSPMIINWLDTETLFILFGSGGETVGGKLWLTTVSDLMDNDISYAKVLWEDTCKGFIAAPSFADITADGYLDVIVPVFNEELIVLDGQSLDIVWKHTFEGHENYVSPVVGQLVGDDTPDIYHLAIKGHWPFYFGCRQVVIDGKTGRIAWEDDCRTHQFSNPNVIDWNEDGRDELLMLHNFDSEGASGVYLKNQWKVIEPISQDTFFFGKQRDGINLYSVPQITDLDNNGRLDIVYGINQATSSWLATDGFTIERIELPFTREEIGWAGYFGTNEDGTYRTKVRQTPQNVVEELITVFPNPTTDIVYFKERIDIQIYKVEIYDTLGRLVLTSQDDQILLKYLPQGTYYYQAFHNNGMNSGRIIKL